MIFYDKLPVMNEWLCGVRCVIIHLQVFASYQHSFKVTFWFVIDQKSISIFLGCYSCFRSHILCVVYNKLKSLTTQTSRTERILRTHSIHVHDTQTIISTGETLLHDFLDFLENLEGMFPRSWFDKFSIISTTQ